MTAESYLKYTVREIHTAIVATVDDEGLPATAATGMMVADEHGLYFLAAKSGGFYDRLVKRQYLALTALKGEDTMSCVAVSVHGKIRKLGNEKIPELFELDLYMKKTYPTEESMQALTVFQIYEGSGEYFNLLRKPIERISFTFGGAERRAEGYFITGAYTGCGSYAAVCPRSYILTERIPYVIERGHCLHCGDYLTACPVGTMERRARTVPGTAVLRRAE